MTPWDTVCVDVIGSYKVQVKQNQGSIRRKNLILCSMTFNDPAARWFEKAEVPSGDYCNLESAVITESKQDDQYLQKILEQQVTDKSSVRVSQLFNQTWLSRYPRPSEVIFDNRVEFRKDFLPLLEDYEIKPNISTTI